MGQPLGFSVNAARVGSGFEERLASGGGVGAFIGGDLKEPGLEPFVQPAAG
jgi:acyl dehydratase